MRARNVVDGGPIAPKYERWIMLVLRHQELPEDEKGDIVCSIRADGYGSMFVTSSTNPNGCSQSEFKDRGMGGVPTGDMACLKWVNGRKRDLSKVKSGPCKASSYPDDYRTEAGWTICVRYSDGTMVVSKDPKGCNNT
jgi:hypothetical protein